MIDQEIETTETGKPTSRLFDSTLFELQSAARERRGSAAENQHVELARLALVEAAHLDPSLTAARAALYAGFCHRLRSEPQELEWYERSFERILAVEAPCPESGESKFTLGWRDDAVRFSDARPSGPVCRSLQTGFAEQFASATANRARTQRSGGGCREDDSKKSSLARSAGREPSASARAESARCPVCFKLIRSKREWRMRSDLQFDVRTSADSHSH
jgi:hypothetical protein